VGKEDAMIGEPGGREGDRWRVIGGGDGVRQGCTAARGRPQDGIGRGEWGR